ncbi:ArsA family ATPase [Rudaeicoccus suwonensis]|uniref:Arsenite efflux ATP-binding protein ArsA n=1 Tax=Rudaeicoccus suwonensis TaxID=657409 RepID=A0A561EBN9_9MICO|nr:hypothetical protein [Rudaeicoccus suwonensis]TWE13012.1 arsenite efflux ATP-binding protein ArsA [Rudaeicoccus suwonensis]
MPPTIVLVGGTGGSGVSTYAAAIARAGQLAGRTVTVVDLDPAYGAAAKTSFVESDRPAHHLAEQPEDGERFAGGLAALLDAFGIDPRLGGELATTTTAAQLRLLWSVPVADDRLVVIDAGPAVAELARLIMTLPWICSRLGEAGPGWLATARPLLAAALGRSRSMPDLTAGLQVAGSRATALRAAVAGTTGGCVLVGGQGAVGKLRGLAVGVALAGVPIRALAGRPGDRDALVTTAGSVDVVTVGDADAEITPATYNTLVRPTAHSVTVSPVGDGYVWRMSLPLLSFHELDLKRVDDDLVLRAAGHQVLKPLPSALRRCHPTRARLRDGMLEVAFDPMTAGAHR